MAEKLGPGHVALGMIGRSLVLKPTNEAWGRPVVWTMPAFAAKCAFVRNDKEIVCVDLAE